MLCGISELVLLRICEGLLWLGLGIIGVCFLLAGLFTLQSWLLHRKLR